jgi:hypothetical protein
VFTPDVSFGGYTSDEWVSLADLLRGGGQKRAQSSGRSGIVALSAGSRLIKLVHTRRGRIPVAGQVWPTSLPDLADQHRADWALEVDQESLQTLVDRFATGLRPEHDYLRQALDLLSIVRDYAAQGRLRSWPNRMIHWPVPSYQTVHRALDALCPEDKSLVVGVFHEGELHTALAARRRKTGFDRVVGPRVLRPMMGLLSGQWSRDYRHVLTAAWIAAICSRSTASRWRSSKAALVCLPISAESLKTSIRSARNFVTRSTLELMSMVSRTSCFSSGLMSR